MWGVPIAFVLAGDNLIISRGKKPSNKCSVEWGPTVILRGKNPQDRMSALGQKQTSGHVQSMSALPPKADIGTQSRNVRFVPKADMVQRNRGVRFVPRVDFGSAVTAPRELGPLLAT